MCWRIPFPCVCPHLQIGLEWVLRLSLEAEREAMIQHAQLMEECTQDQGVWDNLGRSSVA